MPRPTPTRTRRGFVRSYDKAIEALLSIAREKSKEASDAYKSGDWFSHAIYMHEGAAHALSANYLASLPDRAPKPDTKGRGKR